MMAAPQAAPAKPDSEIGVSMTRSSPNSSMNPLVTLKAPPKTPMSSPMRKTLGSRRISSRSAWLMASRYVTTGIRGTRAAGWAGVPSRRSRREESLGHRLRLRIGKLFRVLDGLLHDLFALFVDRFDLQGAETAFAQKVLGEENHRIAGRPVLAHLLRHVGGVVVLSVPALAKRLELDEVGTLAGARMLDGPARGLDHREDAVTEGDLRRKVEGRGPIGGV